MEFRVEVEYKLDEASESRMYHCEEALDLGSLYSGPKTPVRYGLLCALVRKTPVRYCLLCVLLRKTPVRYGLLCVPPRDRDRGPETDR